MKWRTLPRSLFEDYIGYPSWFENFFGQQANTVDQLNKTLNNGLRFEDNHACEKVNVRIKHDTKIKINCRLLNGRIAKVDIGSSPKQSQPHYWEAAGFGAINLTVFFSDNTTDFQDITVYLFE